MTEVVAAWMTRSSSARSSSSSDMLLLLLLLLLSVIMMDCNQQVDQFSPVKKLFQAPIETYNTQSQSMALG